METAPIKLAPEQERALELMLSGKNVFLTGEAGTGKSTILREFREKCTRECVFLAQTGIAAINVGGATLHSFFQLKPGLLTPDSLEEIGNKSRRALILMVMIVLMQWIMQTAVGIFEEYRKIVCFRRNGKCLSKCGRKNRKVHFSCLSMIYKRRTRPSRSPENRDGETFSSRFVPFAKDTETAVFLQIPVVQRVLQTKRKPSLGRLNSHW